MSSSSSGPRAACGGRVVLGVPPGCLPIVPVGVALRSLAPIQVDPVLLSSLVAIYVGTTLGQRDAWARARWASVEPFLHPSCLSSEGVLRPPRTWTREPAGRWHAADPPLQAVPGAIRAAFRPGSDMVYVDADYSNAHLHVAATRAGDSALIAALRSGDVYADWADRSTRAIAAHLPRWGPGILPARMRAAVKRIFLATINGAGEGRIASLLADGALRPEGDERHKGERHAKDPAAGGGTGPGGWRVVGPRVGDVAPIARFLLDAMRGAYPDLARCLAELRALHAAGPGRTFPVATLTGTIRAVDTAVPVPRRLTPGALDRWSRAFFGGYRTLLSAHWSGVEAEAMDHVLERVHCALVPYGGAPVLPLFDGILVQARREHAEEAASALRELMGWAMGRAGVEGVHVKTHIRPTWGDGG